MMEKKHYERVPSILTHIYVVFKKVNGFLVSRNGLESSKRVSDRVNLQDRDFINEMFAKLYEVSSSKFFGSRLHH